MSDEKEFNEQAAKEQFETFFAEWQDQWSNVFSDPDQMTAAMQDWQKKWGQSMQQYAKTMQSHDPKRSTTAASTPFNERSDDLDELFARMDALEKRMARFERKLEQEEQ